MVTKKKISELAKKKLIKKIVKKKKQDQDQDQQTELEFF